MMKAAVLYAQGDIRCAQIAAPRPKAGEVRIRVRACGVCGSDVPRVWGTAAHSYPLVLGHEFSGEIAELGAGVTGFAVGQRVTAAPLLPCFECVDCQRGAYAQCRHYSFIGSRVQGAMAEYVCVPARNVVPFDDAISFEQGALFEPATVALHALRCADFRGGADVAVLGGGTIGLFTAQWARIFGARSVTVFDLDDERLALTRELGATHGINTADGGFAQRAMALTGGRGYGTVFETAGASATMQMAFMLAANHADLCFVGTPSRDITFPYKLFEQMNRKEFRLTGSWMSYSAPFPGMEWQSVAHYFATGQLLYDPRMIMHTYPLEQAAQAFALYQTPGAVKGRVLLAP